LGRCKYSIALIIGVFLGLFIGSCLFGSFKQQRNALISLPVNNVMAPLGSTNPSSPTVLSDDSSLYEYYSTSYSSYYYRTSSASYAYYHVVWLYTIESGDNFNLYLYSDSSYSTLKASSTRGSGFLDWVLFRPSSSQYYYPRVYRYSGAGYAYLEWERSESLSFGTSYTNSLSSSDSFEVYHVYLSSSDHYIFKLEVPSGGNFDLYLYRLYSGYATSYNGYQESSASSTYGEDEVIKNYEPSYSDMYAIVVVRTSGSGSYTLTVNYDYSNLIVVATFFGILGIIGALICSIAVYNKYSQQPRTRNNIRQQENRRSIMQPISTNTGKKGVLISKIPPPLAMSQEVRYRVCLFCGSKNNKEYIFCIKCGSEL